MDGERCIKKGEGRWDILERITDGFVAYDREWRFTYLNRRMERYFGRPREELLGKSIWEEFPASVNTLYFRELHRAVAEQRPVEFVMPAVLSRRWYTVTAYPSADGLSVYLRDVTTRRIAEEEASRKAQRRLGYEEARFRRLVEAAPEGIWATDENGKTDYVNSRIAEMLRYRPEELKGILLSSIPVEEDDRLMLARVLKRREVEWIEVFDCRLRRSDGSELWALVTTTPLSSDAGEFLGNVTTITDITERKRAEESLRFLSEASRELVRRLDDDAPLQTMARLLVPRFADVCEVNLLDGGEIRKVATTQEEPADPAVTTLLEAEVSSVFRTGLPALLPEIQGEPLKTAILVPMLLQGQPVGVLSFLSMCPRRRYGPADVALARSIAEWAALAIEHRRLYRKALQASQIRDEVLRIVSHDLRDPLHNIGIAAQLILMSAESPRTKQHLARIQRSVSTAHHLIEDLLDIARIEVGKLILERQSHDVARLVNEAIDRLRALAEQKSLEVVVEVSPHLPAISADYHRLLQVFANLLGNAIKYAPHGGWIRVSATCDGDLVKFSVEDNGSGISKDSLPCVFDRFWQAKNQHRAGAGLGLGLAIAKAIVEAHGGSIWVESEEGKGTSVRFTCPLYTRVLAAG